ncbi:unnamed protein product [Cylicocyclus nassatus]|uniref:Uncharacterized protein n=1 Tax=Cylicocyclus nassatus TaxID=53992 RepID=A0AA36GEJ0_CYLNA|nr:unnamed protein product [Cylicocyclus nassatus]
MMLMPDALNSLWVAGTARSLCLYNHIDYYYNTFACDAYIYDFKSNTMCIHINRSKSGQASKTSKAREQTPIKSTTQISRTPQGFVRSTTPVAHSDDIAPAKAERTQISTKLVEKSLKIDRTQVNKHRPKLLPYPEINEPTPSAQKLRLEELEREKKQKIAAGFYQERSDEDDTLEKVESLKFENTESVKMMSRKVATIESREKLHFNHPSAFKQSLLEDTQR